MRRAQLPETEVTVTVMDLLLSRLVTLRRVPDGNWLLEAAGAPASPERVTVEPAQTVAPAAGAAVVGAALVGVALVGLALVGAGAAEGAAAPAGAAGGSLLDADLGDDGFAVGYAGGGLGVGVGLLVGDEVLVVTEGGVQAVTDDRRGVAGAGGDECDAADQRGGADECRRLLPGAQCPLPRHVRLGSSRVTSLGSSLLRTSTWLRGGSPNRMAHLRWA